MENAGFARREEPFLKKLLLIAGFPLVLLMSSCISIGEEFSLAQVGKLRIGDTLMPEVRSIFGSPIAEIDAATWFKRRVHFGDEATVTIWRYTYATATIDSAQARTLQIEFDKDGKVTDYYYSSNFDSDKTDEPVKHDFDIFQARKRITPGSTTRSEVIALLGKNYRAISINKPNIAERWRYGFTRKSENKISGSNANPKIYGKSLDIDFDRNGIVVDIRGESDFPADLAR